MSKALSEQSILRRFFIPSLNRRYIVRVILVIVVAFALFRYVFRPMQVHGESMEPTYRNGQFLFTFKPRYTFISPQPEDIVMVRLAGPSVAFLKRIVAMEGDTVAIHDGYLYVNGNRRAESYVVYRNPDWQLPPRQVNPGHVYVIGDNRGMPIDNHQFGQTPINRVSGGPLW